MRYQDGQVCYNDIPDPCEQVQKTKGAVLGSCGLQVQIVMQEQRFEEWNCYACFETVKEALRGFEDDDRFGEQSSCGGGDYASGG